MCKKNFAASFVTQIRGADKIVKEILLCRNLKKFSLANGTFYSQDLRDKLLF